MITRHQYRQPSPQLADYVRSVLVLSNEQDFGSQDNVLFTQGMPTLLCSTEQSQGAMNVVLRLALYSNSLPDPLLTSGPHATTILYFFKPFALTGLFDVDAAELSRNPIELQLWNPHKTNALKTQLGYAHSVEQKIEVLDHLLAHLASENGRKCHAIMHATDKLMNSQDKNTLADLLKELNYTERTFQRMFRKYTGITSTQFRRLSQFQQSFSQLKSSGFESMSDVVFDNGFADQSHFIRAFKEFSNTTPDKYLRDGLK